MKTLHETIEQGKKKFEDRFSVMLERAERENGESSTDWIEQIDAFLHQHTIDILEAVKDMAEKEELFVLNTLDGVDVADYQMQNKGGGTQAIRFALKSRQSLSSLIYTELQALTKTK